MFMLVIVQSSFPLLCWQLAAKLCCKEGIGTFCRTWHFIYPSHYLALIGGTGSCERGKGEEKGEHMRSELRMPQNSCSESKAACGGCWIHVHS